MNTKFEAYDVLSTGTQHIAALGMSALRARRSAGWAGGANNTDTNILGSPPLRSRPVR
ncbi:MAG: hypothetical protein ABI206_05840 [Antricoccus sp.]